MSSLPWLDCFVCNDASAAVDAGAAVVVANSINAAVLLLSKCVNDVAGTVVVAIVAIGIDDKLR